MERKIMRLKTRIFELNLYRNSSELAQAMGISVSQIYRVQEGKRHINEKFIIGAMRAFPGYKFDDLFYLDSTLPVPANHQATGEKQEMEKIKRTPESLVSPVSR
jgi:transcriptional regulator with XRE-family HTH domain